MAAIAPAVVSKSFITGGKATFTLQLRADYAEAKGLKAHYTYKVTKSKPNEQYGETYFVKIMTGPDNEASYSYLGILNTETGVVRTTAKSRFNAVDLQVVLLNRVLHYVWAGDTTPVENAGFALHHEGKCGCCGRKLTTPESITLGIGPECMKKMAS